MEFLLNSSINPRKKFPFICFLLIPMIIYRFARLEIQVYIFKYIFKFTNYVYLYFLFFLGDSISDAVHMSAIHIANAWRGINCG